MHIRERDHAHRVTVIDRGHAGQCPAAVPVNRNLAGSDDVDDAVAEADEERLIGGGPSNFAWSVTGLEFDSALAKVPHSFGPNAPPKAVNLVRRTLFERP